MAGGDEVQQRLAKQFLEDITGPGVRFRHARPRGEIKGGFEDLCSTELIDPPTVHDLDGVNLWTAIFGIEKDNLNATTVRRFRSWLFGSRPSSC